MQLLILSLLVAVASATYSYPSYYSGYGGYGGYSGYGGYGSGLYGHSYGGTGGHVSYVLGGHSSDLAYSHAPRFSTKSFSKINTFSSNEGVTKIHFSKGTGVVNENTTSVKPDQKETIPIPPKTDSKNETDSNPPNEVDWVDITSKNGGEEIENHDVEKSSISEAIAKKPIKVETNQGNSRSSIHPRDTTISAKKGFFNPVQSDSKENFPSSDSLPNTSKSSQGDVTATDSSHESVHEIITSTNEESKFRISEKLSLSNTSNNQDSTSRNRFVPIPDQDYEDFGSKMDGAKKSKEFHVTQSNVEFVKGGKSAQFSADTIPVLNRSPRKTSTFENSDLSSLVSSSDISSFEAFDVPLPYYYYKQNQRGELLEHEPTLEYIPDIFNY